MPRLSREGSPGRAPAAHGKVIPSLTPVHLQEVWPVSIRSRSLSSRPVALLLLLGLAVALLVAAIALIGNLAAPGDVLPNDLLLAPFRWEEAAPASG